MRKWFRKGGKFHWSRMRLPYKLMLVYTPLIILPALTGIFYVTSRYTVSSQQMTTEYATDLLSLMVQKIDDRLLGYEQLSKQMITDRDLQTLISKEAATSFQAYLNDQQIQRKLNSFWLGNEQNRYIQSIKITTDQAVFTYGTNATNQYGVLDPVYLNKIKHEEGGSLWFAPERYTDGYHTFQAFRLGRTIRDEKLRELGTMTIVVDAQAVTSIFAQTKFQNEVQLQLLNDDGDMLLSNGLVLKADEEQLLTYSQQSIRNGWRLSAQLPLAPLYKPIYATVRVALFVVLFCIALGLVVTQLLVLDLVKPIRKLMINMNRGIRGVAPGQLEHFHGAIEIVEMNDTFISVMYEIEQLMRKGALQEQKKKNAEIRALQNQLSPHFLYNTLNSIRWMAMIQKQDNIKQMVDSLNQLLTYTVRHTGEPVSIDEEIAMLDHYMNIQQVRYRHFSFRLDVSPLIQQALVLKFLLQPLIENALIHGLAKADHPGEIRLAGRLEDGIVRLTVADNGVGMHEDQLQRLSELLHANEGDQAGEKFGLRSVHERIQLHYGTAYGLDVKSTFGSGTSVTISFPFQTDAGPDPGGDGPGGQEPERQRSI